MSAEKEYKTYFKGDKINVKFLFYNRDINLASNFQDITTVRIMELVKLKSLRAMIKYIISKYNSELSTILQELKIKHFIPYYELTYEMNDGFLEVCYHHDKNKYEFIYNTKKGIIMQPIGQEYDYLNQLYRRYYLNGWEDKLAYNLDYQN